MGDGGQTIQHDNVVLSLLLGDFDGDFPCLPGPHDYRVLV